MIVYDYFIIISKWTMTMMMMIVTILVTVMQIPFDHTNG